MEKVKVHTSLDAELIKWVDEKIDQDIWRNRSHAFDRLMMIGKAREANGESLTEIEFPGGYINMEFELSTENIERATKDAEELGISLSEFVNRCIEIAMKSGKFD